jgi:hypothetical protein
MEQWEWAVRYTYEFVGVSIPSFETIHIVEGGEEAAQKAFNYISREPNVTEAKLIRRPVGNWEDADA